MILSEVTGMGHCCHRANSTAFCLSLCNAEEMPGGGRWVVRILTGYDCWFVKYLSMQLPKYMCFMLESVSHGKMNLSIADGRSRNYRLMHKKVPAAFPNLS